MTVLVDYSRLKSMLPPRTAPAQDSLASDPTRLRAWLAELPLANRGFREEGFPL